MYFDTIATIKNVYQFFFCIFSYHKPISVNQTVGRIILLQFWNPLLFFLVLKLVFPQWDILFCEIS